MTISLPIPQGLAVEDVALAANNTLYVNDYVTVRRFDGTLGAVSNFGGGTTNVGVGAKVGQVWATNPVTLRNNSTIAGTMATSSTAVLQAGAIVNGVLATSIAQMPSSPKTLSVVFPAAGAGVALEPDQTKTLSPGSYGSVTVKARATLKLSSGTYYFQSLSVESQGRLSANVAAGAVTINVATTLAFKGISEELPFTASSTKLLIVALGTADMFVESPFVGAIIVPNATLTLSTAAAGHSGSFLARSIVAHQSTVITHRPFQFAAPAAVGSLVAQMRAMDKTMGDSLNAIASADDVTVRTTTDFILTPGSATSSASAAAQAASSAARASTLALQGQWDTFVDGIPAKVSSGTTGLVEGVLATFLADFRTALGRWSPPQKLDGQCKELVQDQLFFDLIERMLADDLPGYTLALSQIERALSCTTLENVDLYADAVALALRHVVVRFPAAYTARVQNTLVASLANLIILIHDDTKSLGQTKLLGWYVENVNAMRDVFIDNASLIRRAGLWLRYPSASNLVQIRNLCENSTDAHCISGELLTRALTDPYRLGAGVCSALEMASTPFDPKIGYACDRGLCEPTPDVNGVFPPATSSPALTRGSHAGGLSPYGVPITALQSKLCGISGARKSSQSSAAWNALLGCGVSSPQSRQKAVLSCLWDAGHVDPNFQLNRVLNFGAWPIDTCGPTAGDPNDGPDDPMPVSTTPSQDQKDKRQGAKGDAKGQVEANRQAIKDSANLRGYDPVQDSTINDAKNHIDNSKEVSHAKFVAAAKANNVPLLSDTAGFTITGPSGISTTYIDGSKADLMSKADLAGLYAHEAVHEILEHSNKSIGRDEKREHWVICDDLGMKACGANLCTADNSCGCSSGNAYAATFKSCIAPQLPTGLPAVAPIDTLIYPTEDSTSSTWSQCFAPGVTALYVPTTCTQISCAAQYSAAFQSSGCLCTLQGTSLLQAMNSCSQSIFCLDGEPVALPGGLCGCSGAGSVLDTKPGGPPAPGPCTPPVSPTGPLGPGRLPFFTAGMGSLQAGTARLQVCSM